MKISEVILREIMIWIFVLAMIAVSVFVSCSVTYESSTYLKMEKADSKSNPQDSSHIHQ
jgi:capsular polysaccharide biosynthesis protein